MSDDVIEIPFRFSHPTLAIRIVDPDQKTRPCQVAIRPVELGDDMERPGYYKCKAALVFQIDGEQFDEVVLTRWLSYEEVEEYKPYEFRNELRAEPPIADHQKAHAILDLVGALLAKSIDLQMLDFFEGRSHF